MSLMVSISGVRGIVGESLTPAVVLKYAAAFAEYCNRGKIVIGRDGRITGKIIGNIVSSTLLSMGCDVIALGVAPTPTIQIAVEQLGASGGISITASHNPIQWNGLKFIGRSGMCLNVAENKRLASYAERKRASYARWDALGKHTADDSFLRQHIDMVLSLQYLKPDRIQSRKLKVVVDSINSSGCLIIPELLRRLGCNVVELNCNVTGIFNHAPEPLPENLTELCQVVREEKADLGIAIDPDVDRLVLITERGEPFGEEYTITSIIKFILDHNAEAQKKEPTVVVNLSTTRAVDDVAKSFGAKVVRTPVGEINVAQKMKSTGAIVGGEGSGGVILPAVHYGRDAIVGAGLVLQQLAESNGTASELKASLPQYEIVKSKVEVLTHNPDKLLDKIRQRYSGNGKINTEDGLKVDFADSWVHLRKSNTEPLIRIIAEAPTMNQAQSLVRQFKQDLLSR